MTLSSDIYVRGKSLKARPGIRTRDRKAPITQKAATQPTELPRHADIISVAGWEEDMFIKASVL